MVNSEQGSKLTARESTNRRVSGSKRLGTTTGLVFGGQGRAPHSGEPWDLRWQLLKEFV